MCSVDGGNLVLKMHLDAAPFCRSMRRATRALEKFQLLMRSSRLRHTLGQLPVRPARKHRTLKKRCNALEKRSVTLAKRERNGDLLWF